MLFDKAFGLYAYILIEWTHSQLNMVTNNHQVFNDL